MIAFTVQGTPVAQPRYTQGKGGAVFIKPPKDMKEHPIHAYRKAVAWAAKAAGAKPIEGPVVMHVVAVFPRPKTLRRKKDPRGLIPKQSKPDMKNVLCGIEDALEGICYRNDSQIVRHHLSKCWAEMPENAGRTEIVIESLGGDE